MTAPKLLLALNLAVGWAAGPVEACMIRAQWKVGDIDYADVVVTGRIANYGLILDPVIRERNREMAARRGDTEIGGPQSEASTFITDYAQFDIVVDNVLRGDVAEIITVTWDNSTFREPAKMPPGPFLIALRSRKSPLPQLRGPSATVLPTPKTSPFTVLQAPCAEAFIFPSGSEEAKLVRERLAARQ